MKALRLVVVGASLLGIAACQAFAGVESRTLDPPPPGDGGGCLVATDGPAKVRYANLVPSSDKVDVCIRPAGAASYGRPIFREGGADCGSLAYTDVTSPLGAPAMSVDIKFIPAGQTCAAPALSESTNVQLAADASTTITRVGGGGLPEQILAIRDEPKLDGVNLRLRFVHAAPGLKALKFGSAQDGHLPTTIVSPIIATPVPFGASTAQPGAKAGVGAIDASGYLVTAPFNFVLGASEDGSDKAVLQQGLDSRAATYTLFAIGTPNSDNKFPVRGLFCNDNDVNGLRTLCKLTQLPILSATAWNISLFGPNANSESDRRGRIMSTITASTDDFMCLFETARQSDRDLVAKAAKAGNFPYAYTATTDLSTPFTDPTDQHGITPQTPTTPPCGGSVPAQMVNDVYTCMEAKCSTTQPGDPSGSLLGTTDCLSHNCFNQFVGLYQNYPSCYACIIDYVEGGDVTTFGEGKQACTSDVRQPFSFHGENPSMLLSHYPLSNQDVFVLPSTNFRRSILYAQAQLEDQTVDLFCGFLSSPLIASSLPYTGNYGDGATPDAPDGAYHQEQKLQADKLIAWVNKKTQGGHPAIVMGDWHASRAAGSVADLNPDVLDKFRAAPGFSVATGPMWTPKCSDCPKSINSYNGDSQVAYLFHETYLVNWSANATTDESIVYDQAVVPLTGGGTGMLSLYFGLNVKVLRPH